MKTFWIIVVVLAVLLGGWWLLNQPKQALAPDEEGTPAPGENSSASSGSDVGGTSDINAASDEELIGFEVETEAIGQEIEKTTP